MVVVVGDCSFVGTARRLRPFRNPNLRNFLYFLMGITFTPSQVLLAMREYAFKKTYLLKTEKIIDACMKGLTPTEFALVRSIVFPVNSSFPSANSLKNTIQKTIQMVLGSPQTVRYYEENPLKIVAKIDEWNALARLRKPELTRKMESVGNLVGLKLRVIVPFGQSYFDMIEFTRLYENVPTTKVIKDALTVVKKKGWVGVVTPRMCFVLLNDRKYSTEQPEPINEKLTSIEIGKDDI